MSKFQLKKWIIPGVSTLILLILLGGATLAQSSRFTLSWWTLDGGGRASSSGQFATNGTVGQADTGSMASEQYSLNSGFWDAPGPMRNSDSFVYLPVILSVNTNTPSTSQPQNR